MTRRDRIDGLNGLRLALYDEALGAGPRGLSAAEMAAAVADEALRMGKRPEAVAADVAWLGEAGWIVEYTAGRYRARAKEDVLGAPEGAAVASSEERGASSQTPKPETRNPAPKPAVAQLRTPVFAPRTARGGQGTFF